LPCSLLRGLLCRVLCGVLPCVLPGSFLSRLPLRIQFPLCGLSLLRGTLGGLCLLGGV
jgi:hypothetical protein